LTFGVGTVAAHDKYGRCVGADGRGVIGSF
jgi:hypothetical protein